jgi:hypothetical protein
MVMLDTFDPRDVVAALWPALPIIPLFGSMLIGCLVTRNWAAPRVRRRRLQARLADLADHREGKHLLATVRAPLLVVGDVRTGWFRDSDGNRAVSPLRSTSARVAAHIGACASRAETLIRHLEHAGVDELCVDEARRLHRYLVGVHAEVSR